MLQKTTATRSDTVAATHGCHTLPRHQLVIPALWLPSWLLIFLRRNTQLRRLRVAAYRRGRQPLHSVVLSLVSAIRLFGGLFSRSELFYSAAIMNHHPKPTTRGRSLICPLLHASRWRYQDQNSKWVHLRQALSRPSIFDDRSCR